MSAVTAAAAILAFLAIAAALLAIPVDLGFDIDTQVTPRWRLTFGWLFGIVRLSHTGGGADGARSGSRKAKEDRRRKKRLPRLPLRDGAFRRRLWRLTRTLLRRVEIRHLRGGLRLGLADPADTGMAYGMVSPLVVLLNRLPGVEVAVAPDFTRATLSGHAAGAVRVQPIRLLPPLVGLAILFARTSRRKAQR